jgi:hypothetical protein
MGLFLVDHIKNALTKYKKNPKKYKNSPTYFSPKKNKNPPKKYKNNPKKYKNGPIVFTPKKYKKVPKKYKKDPKKYKNPPNKTKFSQIIQKSPQKNKNNPKNTKKKTHSSQNVPHNFFALKHMKAYVLSLLLFLSKNYICLNIMYSIINY